MSEFTALYGQFIERYRYDLVSYAKDIHGIEFDHLQRPIAEGIQRGERLTTIKSGHGVGKTMLLSCVVSWFANTRAPWRIPLTAPTSQQLWDALWPDVRSRFRELPPYLAENFEVQAERIRLHADPDNCFISPRTTSKEHPEALQGIHSENVLIIADEASGIPDEVFEAGQGSMSGENAQTILTGNPTRLEGFFFRSHMDPMLSSLWNRYTINAEQSAWASRDFIASIVQMFGRDSNQYRIRVLGEFPESADESFIARPLVIEAQTREILMPPVRPIWGVDPARFGRDKTSFCERFGPVTMPLIAKNGMDTMEIAGFVINRYRACFPGEEPSQILIDVIGIGAGVVDRLGEQNLPVVGINVSESPPMGSQGMRLRDDLWIRGRQELTSRRCKLPADPELVDQLSQPRYTFTSDGRVKIESKEEMKKRGLSSPDKADSWLLTFGGDASVVLGQSNAWGRHAPRRIRVV